ncbi:Transcriptional activator flo8, partial [Pichia californica]
MDLKNNTFLPNQTINPNQNDNNRNSIPPPTPLDSEPLVKDSAASNTKELLNAYIYDFLLKSGFDSSAAAFFKEANLPLVKDNEKVLDKYYFMNSKSALPKSKMTMDTPQGFIYEWWQVFWDIFNARTNRGSSTNAAQYYHFVNLKQKQDQAYAQAHAQNLKQVPGQVSHPVYSTENTTQMNGTADISMQSISQNETAWNQRRQQEYA